MANIQCKMCGYMVELPEGATVGECPACGSTTTFPKLNSEHTEQLYARAEHFRQLNDFDKAADAYEAVVRELPDDPEAYWGLVLARYGIEYVEDPLSHERIPTCHRVQYESILADGDYKSALEHADAAQRDIYEAEAKRISEIQKGILAISAQEKPFDVFICYKETTDGGSRTKDSAIAQDIYYQLVNAGYKVFFARITLEDKLGQQYEPYIFAALNSAKVMLVIGSKKEYFNAVWVRNEWSRYLALMKKDRSRLLIPCYKDMDAYDIPEELSMLQSQDMSKIGFIQDILHGIKKVLGGDKAATKAAAPAQAESVVEPLLKRVRIFISTGDFSQAIEYSNKVLDKDPENAEAYLSLLLAENKLKNEDELPMLYADLDKQTNFKLAMDFADAPLKARLQAFVKKQKDERRYNELASRFRYSRADDHSLTCYNEFLELGKGFGALDGYRDSEALKTQCEKNAENIKKYWQEKYKQLFEKGQAMTEGDFSLDDWKALAEEFRTCTDFVPEADEMASQCTENAMTLMYEKAVKFRNAKEYDMAIELFKSLGEYADSKEQILQCRYEKALALRDEKKYDGAIELFTALGEYADSKDQIVQCQQLSAAEYRKSIRKTIYIVSAIACAVLIFIVAALVININKKSAGSRRRHGSHLTKVTGRNWNALAMN
ncbi:MAG: TIR domain-containing protein [Victivallales bacterium]|nr:TIR domain-containing protein [Victivallales bacterium]